MGSNSLLDEAEAVAARTGRSSWDGLMLVILGRLVEYRDLLPSVAAEAMETAQNVWIDGGDAATLPEAKARCWQYLKGRPHMSPMDRDERLTRLVLCVLDREQDPFDASEFADFALDMIEGK